MYDLGQSCGEIYITKSILTCESNKTNNWHKALKSSPLFVVDFNEAIISELDSNVEP
jgi:hypothetical protein